MTELTVCILAAGKGSRMGIMGQTLNKALFPINGKAIISHIIEKFPSTAVFVIGLGYLGHQVRQYLNMAHQDLKFKFINVDKFEGIGSGPGYSLLCCHTYLEKPFYFVSCDTLWDNPIDFSLSKNWFGVAQIDQIFSNNYCNFKVVNNQIVSISDKTTVTDSSYKAFVGLCYIFDYQIFWEGLKNKTLIAGEHQISNGLRALIEKTSVIPQMIAWNDVGDESKYKDMVSCYENFDFSKSNEVLYIINSQVIKFFADSVVTEKRVVRSKLNPLVFPTIKKHEGQFFCYDFQPGQTLYKVINPRIFQHFLNFLVKDVWIPEKVTHEKMHITCKKFYYDKTFERIDLYLMKYPGENRVTKINGQIVPSTKDLLAKIPWLRLQDGIPCFIHGDLQFDNILYDISTDSFKLLDWRQDFGGETSFGDIYYDFAKLYGGIVLNYDYIKLNLLSYFEEYDNIFIDFAQRYQTNRYLKILEEFIEVNGYDLYRVKIIVSLIYLNMSPLHNYPFDKLLHSLGRLTLNNELKNLH